MLVLKICDCDDIIREEFLCDVFLLILFCWLPFVPAGVEDVSNSLGNSPELLPKAGRGKYLSSVQSWNVI